MSKVLTLDVTLELSGDCHTIPSVSPQEAFNLLHMPSFGEFVVTLTPNWIEADGLPSVPEPENKE